MCVAVFAINSGSILNDIPSRTLLINGWFPYRHTNSTGFWIAYFHQLIVFSVAPMILFSFDCAVFGVFLRNCCQLKILKNRLENFVEIINEEKLNMKTKGLGCTTREIERNIIEQCIRHHWIILQLSILL